MSPEAKALMVDLQSILPPVMLKTVSRSLPIFHILYFIFYALYFIFIFYLLSFIFHLSSFIVRYIGPTLPIDVDEVVPAVLP
jgi:hypothetical protein